MVSPSTSIAWEPHPQQFKLLRAKHVPLVFFGGARGGGKTDCLLADFAQDVGQGQAWKGLFIRSSYPELREAIGRFREVYEPTGMKFYKSDKRGEWPNGAELVFQSIENWDDMRKVQGYNRPWVGVDEVTNYSDERVVRGLLAINRGHPLHRMRLSGNPGGPGHAFIKSWFIDPYPMGEEVIEDGDVERMFIRSLPQDNPTLLANNPKYLDNLAALGSEELVRAWLYGDWNVTLGAYFQEFGTEHIVKPFEIPAWWTRFRAIDWGIYHPAACVWLAVADATMAPLIPEDSLVIYREYYAGDNSDKGLGLTAHEFGSEVVRLSQDEDIAYTVADPSCLPQRGPIVRGPSIAEEWMRCGLSVRGADNNRVAGWSQIRQRFRGLNETPLIYFFSTVTHTIRTIPLLQHDKRRPEDLDTTGPDHLADALRYGCMSRPWKQIEEKESEEAPSLGQGMTFKQLEELHKRYG